MTPSLYIGTYTWYMCRLVVGVLSSFCYAIQGGCTDLSFDSVKLNMLLHLDGVRLDDIKPTGEYMLRIEGFVRCLSHINCRMLIVCM